MAPAADLSQKVRGSVAGCLVFGIREKQGGSLEGRVKGPGLEDCWSPVCVVVIFRRLAPPPAR